MRSLSLTLAMVFAMWASSLPAQQFGPEPDADTRSDLLALREAAWRAWFSNDREGFQRIVPDELMHSAGMGERGTTVRRP